jgi:ribosomal protein L11 methyltransferase
MPAHWLRITARSPSEELAGLLAEGLLASGGSAIEEDGADVVTYVPIDSRADAGRISDHVARTVAELLGDAELSFDVVDDRDWLALWRSGLEPRRVGPRIVVAPTWSEWQAGPDDVVIRIDPQMAFGTGEHATTRGVLRLLQQVLRHGDRVIDVGAGSAILAIAAVRLGAGGALAVENDPDAMENAAENIVRNDVADEVTLLCESVDAGFLDKRGGGAFDGILANVLSSVLLPLLPAFHRALSPDGWAILSGILAEEAQALRSAATGAGFVIAAEDAEGEWWSVLLRRG